MSQKNKKTQQKQSSTSRSRRAEQRNAVRDPDSLHYKQEGESPFKDFYDDESSWANVLDLSPMWKVHTQLQELRQIAPLSIVPRLNLKSPDYESYESESESSEESNIALRVVRTRNRDRLAPGQRRRFNNMMKFLISGIKEYAELYRYDPFQSDEVCESEMVEKVFNELIVVLKKLSSKTAKKDYLIMLFNHFNLIINQSIRDKKKNNRAEKLYLKIVDKYEVEIINQAKMILRAVVRNALKNSIISQEACKRGFDGTPEEVQRKREKFEQYFLNFRHQLRNNEIRAIIRKRNVLNQPLYKP